MNFSLGTTCGSASAQENESQKIISYRFAIFVPDHNGLWLSGKSGVGHHLHVVHAQFQFRSVQHLFLLPRWQRLGTTD
jgi:hypothetical protein